MNEFLLMCIEFFKAGLFAVGGGLATLPFLQDIATAHPNWFSVSDLADMLAVAESTPGPIGVNMSTYAGFKSFGVWGGIATTLSLVLPSFIVVLIVSRVWEKYKTNEKVQKIFAALRAAAIGLIFSACLSVFISAIFPGVVDLSVGLSTLSASISIKGVILFAILVPAIAFSRKKGKNITPIVFIIISAIVGIVFKF